MYRACLQACTRSQKSCKKVFQRINRSPARSIGPPSSGRVLARRPGGQSPPGRRRTAGPITAPLEEDYGALRGRRPRRPAHAPLSISTCRRPGFLSGKIGKHLGVGRSGNNFPGSRSLQCTRVPEASCRLLPPRHSFPGSNRRRCHSERPKRRGGCRWHRTSDSS